MSDLDNAAAALAKSLTQPAKASGDQGSMEARSIPDLIMAHRYLAGLAAAKTGRKGVRYTRLIPEDAARMFNCGRTAGRDPWTYRL